LLKAQRDLKKYTDISFEFEPIKRGRAVYELLFHIYSNQPGEEKKERIVIEPVKKKKEASLIEMEIYEQVKTWIGMNTVQTWIKKYPIEQIKNGISYTLQQIEAGKKIPNVGGYLNTMVQKEGVVDTTQIKRQEILKKKEKKEEIEYMKRQIKESLKMLQLEYMKEEDEIIHLLLDGNTTLRAEILKIVCSSRFSQYNHALSFDENMENPMVRAAYRNTIKKKLPEHFVKVSSVYETKIKTLKQQLVEL
jgi:plasmid replication initiation protein